MINNRLLAAIILLTSLSASSQDPSAQQSTIVDRINQSASVEVILPKALHSRLTTISPNHASSSNDSETPVESSQPRKTGGYRVQIFSDNNARTAKNEARTKAKAIAASFPQYPTYVTFTSPYWRLKVGDFKSHDEAEVAATQIKRAFPDYAKEIRVVRDRINIK